MGDVQAPRGLVGLKVPDLDVVSCAFLELAIQVWVSKDKAMLQVVVGLQASPAAACVALRVESMGTIRLQGRWSCMPEH